jgi:ABC-type Zn2+ transport system substrate-binding protein/surface adhesin
MLRLDVIPCAGWLAMLTMVGFCQGTVLIPIAQANDDMQESHQHEMTEKHHHEQGATEAMTETHQHMGLHMKWTTRRPLTSDDEARAAHIAQTLRDALAKYQDYHVAIKDGFEPFTRK